MDKDGVLKNNEVGGESLSNTEKIVAELGDFVKKPRNREITRSGENTTCQWN